MGGHVSKLEEELTELELERLKVRVATEKDSQLFISMLIIFHFSVLLFTNLYSTNACALINDANLSKGRDGVRDTAGETAVHAVQAPGQVEQGIP